MQFSTLFVSAAIASVAAAQNYATYPPVPKTASINGLADRFYDKLPECGKTCFTESTKITPCPYWDTGCLCVMSNWSSNVAKCVAEKCKGSDVASATSLAVSACSAAGVGSPYWFIDGAASTALATAQA